MRAPGSLCAVLGLATLLAAGPAAAQGWLAPGADGQDLEVWLMTVAEGDDIPSWFGHTALWLRAPKTGEERLYGFGQFEFGHGRLLQYLVGRLWFSSSESWPSEDVAYYSGLDREVRLQLLDLPAERRLDLARFLAESVRPENRLYLYDHYFDNCATRVRDAIDRAVGGELHRATSGPARLSLRQHTRRCIQRNPYLDIVLNLWMGPRIDRPIAAWDEMFLPDQLEAAVDRLQLPGPGGPHPLVAARQTLYRSERPSLPAAPNRARYVYALGALALGGAFAWAARRTSPRASGVLHALFGAVFGFPGLIVVSAWFTNHTVAYWNQNFLLASPLTFALLPLGVGMAAGARRAVRWSEGIWLVLGAGTVLALTFKLVPALRQDNAEVLASYGVLNLAVAADVLRRRRVGASGPGRS